MKRALVVVMAAFLLVVSGWAVVQGGTQSKDVAITGKISCTFCNLPAPGNCTKECCQACISTGDPVLLTDAKGNLYLLLSGEKEKPLMTEERKGLLQEKVTVRGKLVKRGGIQGIYVKSMEKAS